MALFTRKSSQPRTRIRETGFDLAFNIVNTTFLVLVFIAVLYPLIYIVSASFSDPIAVSAGKVILWPVNFTLKGYQRIFEYSRIWSGYMNSIFYAVVGTLVNVTMTILAAYPLSRKDLFGRKVIMFLFVFSMMFSGGLIPFYLVVHNLGMYNTRWAMIIPTALSVWNMIITITFFRSSLPQELLEAAQLDGCSDIQYLWKIVLPLSAPIIAVLCLFYAVGHWNQFFNALIFLADKDLFPLQLVLRDILIANTIDLNMLEDARTMAAKAGLRDLLKFSLIIVSSVPVLAIYPFVQKHFVKGLMIGAIKG
ncbi:MAG: carbohydrate ABC transporter permease [Chloroflexi bacterium]|nr:carbohydrate ABC transporter permease [Chloroflexota bacterium]